MVKVEMQTHKLVCVVHPVTDRVFVSAAVHALNLQESDCIFQLFVVVFC